MMMMTFDRSPLAHLRSIAREKITALSPGFNAAWWWPSPCLQTYMTFMNMMGIIIIILVPHDRHDDLYEGNHDCCVSIQPDEWWWSSWSFEFWFHWVPWRSRNPFYELGVICPLKRSCFKSFAKLFSRLFSKNYWKLFCLSAVWGILFSVQAFIFLTFIRSYLERLLLRMFSVQFSRQRRCKNLKANSNQLLGVFFKLKLVPISHCPWHWLPYWHNWGINYWSVSSMVSTRIDEEEYN